MSDVKEIEIDGKPYFIIDELENTSGARKELNIPILDKRIVVQLDAGCKAWILEDPTQHDSPIKLNLHLK